MSVQKGYCLHCETNNEKNRIFFVNPDADVCFCPNCLREMDPKQAIKIYHDVLNSHVNDAKYTLLILKDFENAYYQFGSILELESECTRAKLGRLLSLLFLSKLRNAHFQHFLTLLKSEAPTYFHQEEYAKYYFSFIVKVFEALDHYKELMFHRLTIKKRFYDFECVKLYFQRLTEIVEIKEFLIQELNYPFLKQFDKGEISTYKQTLISEEEELKKSIITTDGYHYTLVGFNRGSQLISRSETREEIQITKYAKYSLDINNKEVYTINDRMFKDGSASIKLTKSLIPLFIVFISLAAVFGLITLILNRTNIALYKSFIYPTGALAFLAFASLTIYIVRHLKLKRRRRKIST